MENTMIANPAWHGDVTETPLQIFTSPLPEDGAAFIAGAYFLPKTAQKRRQTTTKHQKNPVA